MTPTLVLLATGILGGIFGTLLRKLVNLKNLLIFSGAFLFGIIAFHLLPDLYKQGQNAVYLGGAMLMGFMFQIILEGYSKGVEHGHTVLQDTRPLTVLLAVTLHALLEAIPSNMSNELLLGISMHKIPIGMALFILLSNQMSVSKSWAFYTIFIISAPIGTYLYNYIPPVIKPYLLPFSIGMMVHVAQSIIFEFNSKHDIDYRKIGWLLLGFGVSILI